MSDLSENLRKRLEKAAQENSSAEEANRMMVEQRKKDVEEGKEYWKKVAEDLVIPALNQVERLLKDAGFKVQTILPVPDSTGLSTSGVKAARINGLPVKVDVLAMNRTGRQARPGMIRVVSGGKTIKDNLSSEIAVKALRDIILDIYV